MRGRRHDRWGASGHSGRNEKWDGGYKYVYLCEVRRVDEGRWAAMQGVSDLWTRARTHLVARRRRERMETHTEPVVVNEVVGGGGGRGWRIRRSRLE